MLIARFLKQLECEGPLHRFFRLVKSQPAAELAVQSSWTCGLEKLSQALLRKTERLTGLFSTCGRPTRGKSLR